MEITSIQEIEGSRGAVPVAQSFLWDMKGKPEILAPAGSVEGMRAAVAAGCDAVYMGGSRFGARAYAGNPEEDEMLEALAYCHLHGVKLYMTVNTLLKNREIEEVLFSFLRHIMRPAWMPLLYRIWGCSGLSANISRNFRYMRVPR